MTGLLVDAGGWAGAVALLLAYGLVSSGRVSGRSAAFQLLNLFGAVGLLVNGVWHGAWPSAALNGVWLVLGVHALSRLRLGGRPATAPSDDLGRTTGRSATPAAVERGRDDDVRHRRREGQTRPPEPGSSPMGERQTG